MKNLLLNKMGDWIRISGRSPKSEPIFFPSSFSLFSPMMPKTLMPATQIDRIHHRWATGCSQLPAISVRSPSRPLVCRRKSPSMGDQRRRRSPNWCSSLPNPGQWPSRNPESAIHHHLPKALGRFLPAIRKDNRR